MKRIILALTILSIGISVAFSQIPKRIHLSGVPYPTNFAGKKTASGENYDPNKLTAAHFNFPFGTKIEIQNLIDKSDGESKKVTVVINDRSTDSTVLKISARAAEMIGITNESGGFIAGNILTYGDGATTNAGTGSDGTIPGTSVTQTVVITNSVLVTNTNVVEMTNTTTNSITNNVTHTITNIVPPSKEKIIEKEVMGKEAVSKRQAKLDKEFIKEEPLEETDIELLDLDKLPVTNKSDDSKKTEDKKVAPEAKVSVNNEVELEIPDKVKEDTTTKAEDKTAEVKKDDATNSIEVDDEEIEDDDTQVDADDETEDEKDDVDDVDAKDEEEYDIDIEEDTKKVEVIDMDKKVEVTAKTDEVKDTEKSDEKKEEVKDIVETNVVKSDIEIKDDIGYEAEKAEMKKEIKDEALKNVKAESKEEEIETEDIEIDFPKEEKKKKDDDFIIEIDEGNDSALINEDEDIEIEPRTEEKKVEHMVEPRKTIKRTEKYIRAQDVEYNNYTEPEIKTDSQGYSYAVQVGAFSKDKNANRIYNNLRSRGYSVFKAETKVKRRRFIRVRVGYYDSIYKAKQVLDKLAAYRINGMIVKIKMR